MSDSSTGQQTATQRDQTANQNEPVAPIIRSVGGEFKSKIYDPDPYAEERNKRERRDITAQESMAVWARAMFWVTVAMAIFSFVGIVLVYITFRAALGANDIQRESLRAWVRPDILKPDNLSISLLPQSWECRFQLKLKNYGQSPAQKITSTSKSWMKKRAAIMHPLLIPEGLAESSYSHTPTALFPAEEWIEFIQVGGLALESPDGRDEYNFAVTVEYESQGEKASTTMIASAVLTGSIEGSDTLHSVKLQSLRVVAT